MASSPDAADKDIRSQLDELRAQVSALLNDKVGPGLAEMRHEAEDAVHQVRETASCQAATVAREIRERPFTSVLIAAAVGLLVGRLTR